MDAYLIVDPDARTIEVPEVEEVFGVYGDNNAERKYFKCPRIVGNKVDLSKCYIYVNYISAATKVGQIMCDIGDVDGVDTNGDEIVFSWPITRNVLDKNESTNLFFAVQAKTTTGDTVFTTRKAEGFCYESIEGTEAVAEEYADIVLQLISRMDNVEANIGEQVAAYFKENPAVTAEYLDQTLQPVKDSVSELKEDVVYKGEVYKRILFDYDFKHGYCEPKTGEFHLQEDDPKAIKTATIQVSNGEVYEIIGKTETNPNWRSAVIYLLNSSMELVKIIDPLNYAKDEYGSYDVIVVIPSNVCYIRVCVESFGYLYKCVKPKTDPTYLNNPIIYNYIDETNKCTIINDYMMSTLGVLVQRENAFYTKINVKRDTMYRITTCAFSPINPICVGRVGLANTDSIVGAFNPPVEFTRTIWIKGGSELYVSGYTGKEFKLERVVESECEPKNENLIDSKTTIVNCWGDSLTQGYNSYVTSNTEKNICGRLQTLLGDEFVVNNFGVGGETLPMIGGRQGGTPYYVQPFTIPGDTSKVEITLTSYNGTDSWLYKGIAAKEPTNLTVNPCEIDGIKGEITSSTVTDDNTTPTLYFNKLESESGESHIVKRPTVVLTNAHMNFRNAVQVIWAGTNGGFNWDNSELCKLIQQIANNTDEYKPKFIIVGLHSYYDADRESAMSNAFGQHFVNIREYICTKILNGETTISCYGLDDENLTATTEDIKRIDDNLIPRSLLANATDNTHMNEYGYDVVARLIYKKGHELGYW